MILLILGADSCYRPAMQRQRRPPADRVDDVNAFSGRDQIDAPTGAPLRSCSRFHGLFRAPAFLSMVDFQRGRTDVDARLPDSSMAVTEADEPKPETCKHVS